MSYPSPQQPVSIKLINRLGRVPRQLGLSAPSLAPEKLIVKAQKQTGLSDFGDDSFRLGLDRLTAALENEARLSTIGRIAAHGMLLDNLKIRLQLTDYRKQRPVVAEQLIKRPLFVLGLPRTGTTILYELLAQDPAHRAPMSWEVSQPIPPAQLQTFTTDPRIPVVDKILQQTEMLAPGFKAIHAIGAELPRSALRCWPPILSLINMAPAFSYRAIAAGR
ncbi:sulfotransferase [Oceanicoccus sp. KOV_DT_Chl]|uniref:sulfotransferase n=1 Tax=Oceanicoccus sp. KOV_DT_Chl TaxID=1904639 RepID=UPI000C7B4191|nr:sulfotransferase [Oceanicoccus sp. KOV_DT_Chl]